MKIAKKDRQRLEYILESLFKAQKYIMREDTLICSTMLPNLTSFYNKDGVGINVMEKRIGSDLCYLYNATATLHQMLNPTPVEKNNG